MKRKLLKDYVKGIIKGFTDLRTAIATEIALLKGFDYLLTPAGQAEIGARIYEKAGCFRTPEQIKHGSVYAFIMDPVRGVSFMNGLDFDLHGLSVSLTDPDPVQCDGASVLTAFQNAVTNGSGDLAGLANGNSGTVTYHWDNPTVDGDEVENFLAKGVVPGTSIKESYLEVVDITGGFSQPVYLVFGSGIYLDSADKETCESADDDGGCAIAATGSTHQGALLNLFLIASVLFSAVFLRKRS